MIAPLPDWTVKVAEAIKERCVEVEGDYFTTDRAARLIHEHSQAREREIVEDVIAVIAASTVLESTRVHLKRAIRERFAALLEGK